MIVDILEYVGAVALAAPISRAIVKIFQFRNDVSRGKEIHDFEPKIIRDIHMGRVTTRWCAVCNRSRKAYIHLPERDDPIPTPSRGVLIQDLEAKDIKWRFENDPEWVQVFGEEYDPKTGYPIPQLHNGECGGPHDSCERCAWEADEAEKVAEEKARAEGKKKAEEKAAEKQKISKLDQEEIDGYESILWTLWNTTHEYKHAKEEWEELLDEIGMMTNDKVRRAVKKSVPFLRITYIMMNFDNPETAWRRREEKWQDKRTKDLTYEKIRRHGSPHYGW